jgi:hypothetical protein
MFMRLDKTQPVVIPEADFVAMIGAIPNAVLKRDTSTKSQSRLDSVTALVTVRV